MISLSYKFEDGIWTVYGTKVIDGRPVTRPFEQFKTKKGAENYIRKYEEKRAAYYAKKKG